MNGLKKLIEWEHNLGEPLFIDGGARDLFLEKARAILAEGEEEPTVPAGLVEWAKDHYWDSLAKDKEIILLHLSKYRTEQATAPKDLIEAVHKWADHYHVGTLADSDLRDLLASYNPEVKP